MITVSLILPALYLNDEYRRCIYSIRTALSNKVTFEVISIVRDVESFSSIEASDLKIIKEDGPGIYDAMNQGLSQAVGEFVYFIGQDDILLPAASDALMQGLAVKADIVIANVFYGHGSIFRNFSSKHVLAWRNWCHQGLFYNRKKFNFIVETYPAQFTVQADHYANIVFCADSAVNKVRINQCVAWYSSEGFSSTVVDRNFRAAFPRLVRENIGYVDYLLVVLRRYIFQRNR
ncbi:MAG: hypothetical protein DCF26_09055 [Burkholderiales bacterium]|nr:MAG: hypothetical protein DCF26_09055 [Burkholderiales bacterium]